MIQSESTRHFEKHFFFFWEDLTKKVKKRITVFIAKDYLSKENCLITWLHRFAIFIIFQQLIFSTFTIRYEWHVFSEENSLNFTK